MIFMALERGTEKGKRQESLTEGARDACANSKTLKISMLSERDILYIHCTHTFHRGVRICHARRPISCLSIALCQGLTP